MIGNLILALGIACVCVAPLVDEIQPRRTAGYTGNVVSDTVHSDVLDADVYCFSRGQFSVNKSDFDSDLIYSWRYILDTTGDSSADFINYSNPPTGNLSSYYNAMQFAYWQSDTINPNSVYFFIQWSLGDANTSVYQIRCFVPFNSGVGGIEITPFNNQYTLLSIGDGIYNTNADATYYRNEGNVPYCLVESSNASMDGNIYTSNFPFKFASYCQTFVCESHTISFGVSLYGSIESDYNLGFQSGYASGYTQGSQDGYLNGYAEGISTASSPNASFLSLMASIADVPIRYLKQMFSFELFGINVAVVILSCLTAVIIFGIVKKVWK